MKILIIKTSALGDIIHAFPILPFLKQVDPHIEIDWVVEAPFAELVQAHPLINHVLTIQTKKWRLNPFNHQKRKEITEFRRQLRSSFYDIVLDLQGNVKSGLITLLSKSAFKVGFGLSTVPEWPNVMATHKRFNPLEGQNIREDYLFLAKEAIKDWKKLTSTSICQNTSDQSENAHHSDIQLRLSNEEQIQLESTLEKIQKGSGLNIMVCPGSNWQNKQLPSTTLEIFLGQLTQALEAKFVFIWGNQAEKTLVQELVRNFPGSLVIERLPLPILQNLMSSVDLVIAMDSLPLHLAGTTQTPTYSIFGASSAEKYKPNGNQHAAFQGPCPYHQSFEKRCPILRTCETGACIKAIESKQLFNHFTNWWGNFPNNIN